MPIELRKAMFYLDGMDGSFEGYTMHKRWNGWAIPYFTKEVADEIANRIMAETNDVVRYRKDLDAYLVYLEGSHDIEQFSAETINGMTLYSLGGRSWTWDEDDELTAEFFEQHLHDTVETCKLFDFEKDSDLEEPPIVKIELAGKSIEIPLNADLYESLVHIMKEETEYQKQLRGETK